jgi:hypothetical protein
MDIIFDIDGTLANGAHRRHHLEQTPKDWDSYQAQAHLDSCHEPVAVLARSLPLLAHRVILCTGRGEHERTVTEEWLRRYQIPYAALYMRTQGDYRPDDEIKAELLEKMWRDGFEPELVFEDRDRVVKMWRGKGLVCCQVADVDF